MSKDPIEKALAEPWLRAPSAMTEIDNWGEPTDAAKQKDAEIEHLKLEMDGVDNAKEEIGRLLGLTEEFRWKRISAAIHEQKRLIRELEESVAGLIVGHEAKDALISELLAALTDFLEFGEYAYSYGRDAIAKAKAQGFDP